MMPIPHRMASSTRDVANGSSMQNMILYSRVLLRDICCAASVALLLAVVLCPEIQAKEIQPGCPLQEGPYLSQAVMNAGRVSSAGGPESINTSLETPQQLIVIGFMGGRVRGSNLVHREALLAKDLQHLYPLAVHAAVFANHDGSAALKTVLQLLDKNKDDCLSAKEKNGARIVIFGHSWGASETIALAKRLNELSIPVLLTIQVDSVEKPNENDGRIPPNVREAVNFYQSEGLLHGRSLIEATDPKQTTILGNFESTYRKNPVSCAGYPWYARAFMKSHIEIENDPSVWNKIEALIRTRVL